MNRVLKFRLWDKKHEAWEDAQYMAIVLDGTIMLGAHHSVEPERYVIQQFTGLTDKNGAEIYEGDILKIEGVGIAQVLMEHGQWVTYREDYLEVGGALYGWLCPIEIIGNIYEHPELLNAG